eukprot:g6426.t1
MSFLRRLPLSALRSFRSRGAETWPGGSFWAPGQQKGPNGYLFGETPPPPGMKRRWESWEMMYYITYGGGPLALWICMMAAPDSRLETWARKQAEKELLEEYGPEMVTPAEWKKTIS